MLIDASLERTLESTSGDISVALLLNELVGGMPEKNTIVLHTSCVHPKSLNQQSDAVWKSGTNDCAHAGCSVTEA